MKKDIENENHLYWIGFPNEYRILNWKGPFTIEAFKERSLQKTIGLEKFDYKKFMQVAAALRFKKQNIWVSISNFKAFRFDYRGVKFATTIKEKKKK